MRTLLLLFEVLPYCALLIWLIYSSYLTRKALKTPELSNRYFLDLIPQIFTTIGILGTFIGIAIGLYQFDTDHMETSIKPLLNGLKTAFIASIFGIMLSIIFSKILGFVQHKNEKGKLSQEAIRLDILKIAFDECTENVNESVRDLTKRIEEIFIVQDEKGNKVKAGNFLRDISTESRVQTGALKSFSTDLAQKIEIGFDKLSEQQTELNTIPFFEKLQLEIQSLGAKLQDPATEMTQNMTKDIQAAMKSMMDDFKTSVSGSTKSELENLTDLLSRAGGILTDFPSKLEVMTNNLNDSFRRMHDDISVISQKTFSQSNESTDLMRTQVKEMSEILKEKIGGLQTVHTDLLTREKDNLNISDNLLRAFNSSIENMNRLSGGINETIKKFSQVQEGLNSAALQLRSVSENVGNSTNSFKNAQASFAEHTNVFLATNKSTIDEIQNSLLKAKDVSADFAQKFIIIEDGLKSIFGQIQTGLEDYNNTVGAGLQEYLGKYSDALTTTTGSLSGQSAKHEEMLDMLIEQVSKFNSGKN